MLSEPVVLVTGGCGFVGLNLVEAIAGAGHTVVVVDTAPPPPSVYGQPWAERVTWVSGTLEHIVDQVERASVVMHLAAITADVDRERRDAAGIVEVNVAGTQAVLDASRRLGAERFVYVSSGAVYGNRSLGSEPIHEDTPTEPVTLYGITKLAGEQLATRHAVLWDIPVTVARLGPVFGPWERVTGVRDTVSPFHAVAERARLGGHVRIPKTAPRAWTYARDVAGALSHFAVGPVPEHQRYLVASPTATTLEAWARHLSGVFSDFTFEVVAGSDSDIPYDGDPTALRAPFEVDRIAGSLPRWPIVEDPFADYTAWLLS